MTNENDIKESHREQHGTQLDSVTITSGSAAKGTAIQVKAYFDASKPDEAQAKVDGALKIRGYLSKLGLM